jgi:hypothetical protein
MPYITVWAHAKTLAVFKVAHSDSLQHILDSRMGQYKNNGNTFKAAPWAHPQPLASCFE